MIDFEDMFEEDLGTYKLSKDDGLKAGKEFTKTYYWSYNKYDKENRRLRNTYFDKLVIDAYPIKILFADG